MTRAENIVKELKKYSDIKPVVGIILGSHLGDFDKRFRVVNKISYSMLDNFPTPKTEGHKGRFIFGYVDDIPIVIMQGRIHYYEGYKMEDVVLPIECMNKLGIKSLYITNSAQSLNLDFNLGDLVVVNDYIMMTESPLRNLNISYDREKLDSIHPIFDKEMIKALKKSKEKYYDINLKEGVYLQIKGANVPSNAESKMYKILGADLVGMSSICEAMYAKYLGIRVACISCVSSYANGISNQLFTHTEIVNNYKKERENIVGLIHDTIIYMEKK